MARKSIAGDAAQHLWDEPPLIFSEASKDDWPAADFSGYFDG